MDCSTFSFDLHVLGTPPALILSQDQTLVYILKLLPDDGGRRSNCLHDARKIMKDYLVRMIRPRSSSILTTGMFNLIVKDPYR